MQFNKDSTIYSNAFKIEVFPQLPHQVRQTLVDTLEMLALSFPRSQCPRDRLGTRHPATEKVIEPEGKVAEDAEEYISPSTGGVQAVWSPGQQGVQDGAQHGGEVGVAVRDQLREVALQPQEIVLTIVLPCVCWEILQQLLFLLIPQFRGTQYTCSSNITG